MKHDPHLANDLIIQSLEAKLAKLADRVARLESRPRPAKRRAQKPRQEIDAPAFAIMRPICEPVAEKYRLSLADLVGREIGEPRLTARREAMQLCRNAGFSLPVIGRFFDGRDHSTVRYILGRVERRGEVGE